MISNFFQPADEFVFAGTGDKRRNILGLGIDFDLVAARAHDSAFYCRQGRDAAAVDAEEPARVETTLQQIEEKGYAHRFADDKRQLFKIGVRFSTENSRIDSWKLAN